MMVTVYICIAQSLHAIVGCSVRLKPVANGRCLACKSLDTTLLFKCTVQKYIYPSASKVYAGSFRVPVIHRTLTCTTGSLTCIRGHSYACVDTRGLGTPHRQRVSTAFWTRKNSQVVLVPLTGFELGSLMT